jgi:hypothetical protein
VWHYKSARCSLDLAVLHGDAQLAAADMPYGRGIQRSASAMIAAIKPIAVNQDMAEISSSILVPIARSAASDRNRNLMQERRHRNIREDRRLKIHTAWGIASPRKLPDKQAACGGARAWGKVDRIGSVCSRRLL